jgi:N6-L-threonylcarbamoyladenine synthase
MNYYEKSKKTLEAIKDRRDYTILAIESSCDETAVAVTRGRTVLSSVISSQIEIHRRFGGVVPEIASRNHVLAIGNIVEEALAGAKLTLEGIDVVAVTYGPGLLGALLVGVSYAKALAFASGKPLIPIDHIKGHMAANYIASPELQPPYLCLLASGGHTAILKVNSFADIVTLGSTQDDAAGEAFDKVARVLGLPYPGGPEIEKLAKEGLPTYALPRAFKEKSYDFSFSGLKTAIINLVENSRARGEEIRRADLARSFQDEVADLLVGKTLAAAAEYNLSTVALAGGVGANGALRERLALQGAKAGLRILLPPRALCTDNAAMIGVAAYEEIACGALPAELTLDADPEL